MKSIRERFVKNHRTEIRFSPEKGSYKVLVYIGDFYTWEPKEGSFQARRRLFALLEAASILLLILSSIPGTVISYSPFVVCAALVAFAAWVFELYGAISFCFKKLPLQEDDYAYLNIIFKVTPPIRFVFLLFAAGAGIYHMASAGFALTGILACAGYVLTAALAVLIFFLYLKTSKDLRIIPSEYHEEKE